MSEHAERQLVLLFTDIADSVAMKKRLGDAAYLKLLQRHNALFKDAIAPEPGARSIKSTGDGFLAVFPTPAAAVRSSLRFQFALFSEAWSPEPVRVRSAIHAGSAMHYTDDAGAEDVSGFAVDLTARVMGLAIPGQVLLTRHAFDDARQYVREHPACAVSDRCPLLRWVAHGPYVFKGSDEPLEIYEVGAVAVAPLSPPPGGDKARRSVPAGEEDMYDWRPAAGLEVPRRAGWFLQSALGSGGSGEVWVAQNARSRERRAFKFCFDADHLRTLKRELTLFRLLREALGDRRDIARLYEISLEKPPFYLESEYSPHGDLARFAHDRGGIETFPLSARLELLARTADAVAAAHSVGVLHKDLKPSNILVDAADRDNPRPKICDFGIGVLSDRAQLEQRHITVAGFTVSHLTENSASRAGTRVYMPPEMLRPLRGPDGSLRAPPFTAQGDVFALGVLLYQLAVGDLDLPLAPGWERSIEDDLLRADIAEMVDGDPARRVPTAAEVADRVRAQPQRRAQLEADRAEARVLEQAREASVRAELRRRRTRRLAVGVSAVSVALAGASVGVVLHERSLRAQSENLAATLETLIQNLDAEALGYRFVRGLDDEVRSVSATAGRDPRLASNALADALAQVNPTNVGVRTLHEVFLVPARNAAEKRLAGQPADQARLLHQIASIYSAHSMFSEVVEPLTRAVELRRRALGPAHPDTLASVHLLGRALARTASPERAIPLFREAAEGRARTLGKRSALTLESFQHLGGALARAGELAEAERVLTQNLADCREALGDEHERTVDAMRMLSSALTDLGKNDAAAALRAEAASHAASFVAPSNRSRREAELRAALESGDAEALARVVEEHEKALGRAREVLGDDHSDTIAMMRSLAIVRMRLSRFDLAEPLLLEAEQRSLKALGPEHPDTVTATYNLALVYKNLDRPGEALPRLESAHRARLVALGPSHPDTLGCQCSLAATLLTLGRPADAEPVARDAAERCLAALSRNHRDTLSAHVLLATALLDQDRPSDAEGPALAAAEMAADNPGAPANLSAAAARLVERLYGSLIDSAAGAAGSSEPPEARLSQVEIALAPWRERFGSRWPTNTPPTASTPEQAQTDR